MWRSLVLSLNLFLIAGTHSISAPEYKVAVFSSDSFTLEWISVSNYNYTVVVRRLDEDIRSCEGGMLVNGSSVLVNKTSNGASIEPDTHYNIAVCSYDGNKTVSMSKVQRVRSAYPVTCFSLESACVFPFKQGWYERNRCWTTNRVTPWCGTTEDYNRDSQWINCTFCQAPGCTNNPRCHFPFTYFGQTYNTCTPIDNHRNGNQPWCSLQRTLPHYSQINVTWINCEDCNYDDCRQQSVRCVFPFIYKGHSYSSCIRTESDPGPWCSTTANFDRDHQWRNCSLYCLEPPKLKITPLDMTSLKFEWPPLYRTLNHLLITSGSINTFPDIKVDRNSTTTTISGLRPYYNYDVSVVGVGSYPNGSEFQTSAFTQSILMFAPSYCPETTLTHPQLKKEITFPRTQAGYVNISSEGCSSSSLNAGAPLARRLCLISAKWDDPDWLISCDVSIKTLAQMDVSTEEGKLNVATQLSILTSNASSLSSHKIHETTDALRSVITGETLTKESSSRVISCVGNLLKSPKSEFEASKTADKLFNTLEAVTRKVKFEGNEDFQSTEATIALSVLNINKNERKKSGIIFREQYNPTTPLNGFSQKQFVTNYLDTVYRTSDLTSTISISPEALAKSKNGRVRFYAFSDPSLFNVVPSNYFDNLDAISPNSSIQSNSIMSASVDATVRNLNDTITMKFQYNDAVCPSGAKSSVEDCGEFLCGFWDEKLSVWSTAGCKMVSMTQNYIECECDHLTNFATLFAYGNSTRIRGDNILYHLTLICCSISLISALLTILCLLLIRRWKDAGVTNRTSIVIINLAISLVFLNVMLLISSSDNHSTENCTAIAILLHFSLLSTLMWCFVEATYICTAIVKPIYYQTSISSRKLLMISLPLGWGLPALFVLVNAVASISSYQSDAANSTKTCWIVPHMIAYIVIIPCAIILFVILTIYIIMIQKYLNQKKIGESGKTRNSNNGKKILLSISFFSMFGLTWIFGFTLFGSSSFSLISAYFFTILNALQGFLFFVLFIIRNDTIRMSFNKRMKVLSTPSTSVERSRLSSSHGEKISFKT